MGDRLLKLMSETGPMTIKLSGDPEADMKMIQERIPDLGDRMDKVQAAYKIQHPDLFQAAPQAAVPAPEVAPLSVGERAAASFGNQPYAEPNNAAFWAKNLLPGTGPIGSVLGGLIPNPNQEDIKSALKDMPADIAEGGPDALRMLLSTLGGIGGSLIPAPGTTGAGSLAGDKAAMKINKEIGQALGTWKGDEAPDYLSPADLLNFIPELGSAAKYGIQGITKGVGKLAKLGEIPERMAAYGTGLSKSADFKKLPEAAQKELSNFVIDELPGGKKLPEAAVNAFEASAKKLGDVEAAAPDVSVKQIESLLKPHAQREMAGVVAAADEPDYFKAINDKLAALSKKGSSIVFKTGEKIPPPGDEVLGNAYLKYLNDFEAQHKLPENVSRETFQDILGPKTVTTKTPTGRTKGVSPLGYDEWKAQVTRNPRTPDEKTIEDVVLPVSKIGNEKRALSTNRMYEGKNATTHVAADKALADTYREAADLASQGATIAADKKYNEMRILKEALESAGGKNLSAPVLSTSDVLPSAAIGYVAPPVAALPLAARMIKPEAVRNAATWSAKALQKASRVNPTGISAPLKAVSTAELQAIKQFLQGLQ